MNKIAYNFCSFAVKNTKNALKMSKFPLNISLSVGPCRSRSGLVGLGRAWSGSVGLGQARSGLANFGRAWSGTRCQSGLVGHGRAWSGSLLGGPIYIVHVFFLFSSANQIAEYAIHFAFVSQSNYASFLC